MKRVVITGLGAITPLGNSVDTFWKHLTEGKSGAKLITKFDPQNFKTKFACEVEDFDIEAYLPKKEARKMDDYTQLAVGAADACMQDCGFDENWDTSKVGVIWASGIGGIHTFEEELINFAKNNEQPRFNPFFITKMIPNMAAGQLSIRYGLRGVSYATVSACTSSNNAIADAFNFIRLGKAKAILTGGSEAPITRTAVGGFNASKALSTNNENYLTASRPFDQSRDGFVMGEGAGALMLEELEHAKARGAKIYAELTGCGCASDAYHITASHPEGVGAEQAMREALAEAEIKPEHVDYINAHATSTPVGDLSECKAISKLFSQSLDRVHVSATKSMTGHLLGAAGAIEAIACIKAIENSLIPPTINLENLDPEIDPNLQLTLNKAVSKEVQVALNNTFGFGGHIAVSVFKKYEE